jgi:hypothetical protein
VRLGLIALAALATVGCSEAETAKAPPGAMESFAANQSVQDAEADAAKVEEARAREAMRAADARQKNQADAGIARFAEAENAINENGGNSAD